MTSRKSESKNPMPRKIDPAPPVEAPVVAPAPKPLIGSNSINHILENSSDFLKNCKKPPLSQQNSLKKIAILVDPQTSRRGQKKKRETISRGNSFYDEQGRIRQTREDVCDCFDNKCPGDNLWIKSIIYWLTFHFISILGCHNPCPSCTSQKCGLKCRVNRKWTYEIIEHDGKDLVLRNPLITTGFLRTWPSSNEIIDLDWPFYIKTFFTFISSCE